MLVQRDNMFINDANEIVTKALREEYVDPLVANLDPSEEHDIKIVPNVSTQTQ
jgi:hypothetical protein